MRKVLPVAAALSLGIMVASPALGAGPDVAQVLSIKPVQRGVAHDTPERSEWRECKLVVSTKPVRGWVLRDARGLIVRRFLDTNNDNVVDRWSFYSNGQEVYRDIDGNFNGKADQSRWYNSGGSRWAVDKNEDGRIDEWKSLSAEEASAEAVAALADGDSQRLERVVVDADDIRRLTFDAPATERIAKAQKQFGADFRRLSASLGRDLTWVRLEGNNPLAIPAEDVGARNDLALYQNATVITEASGKTHWLRIAELVRIGDVWKLSAAPSLLDPEKPLQAAGVLVPFSDQTLVSTGGGDSGSYIEAGEEIQQHITRLRAHDEKLPADPDDQKALADYHVKRGELCARIGSRSKKMANRTHWYRSAADSLNAAVQTGAYPGGIKVLEQYAGQFAKTSWGGSLAAYFSYRAINAEYAIELAKPEAEHVKVQENFLTKLGQFVKRHPKADDTPDALLQLGNGMEFAGKEADARTHYRRLVADFPDSTPYAKAAGALRRLESEGQPFHLVGGSLATKGSIDTTRYRGKVLVVSYWATWCEPCKAQMPLLKKLRDKYGSKGFEVVGVALDADQAMARDYVRRQGYDWPQIYEPGSMESKPAVEYGVISLPYVVLVDADGQVINRNLQFGQLQFEIEKAMTKKVAAREK